MNKERFIMGIDPGQGGGICIMTESGNVVHIDKMPVNIVPALGRKLKTKKEIDMIAFSNLLARYEPAFVFMELVHAMPKQGVSSTFTFGVNYGCLLGLCRALGSVFITQLVTPMAWHKSVCHNAIGESAKDRAKYMAETLYPGVAGKHDGKIDALLIAEYGRRLIKLT